MAQYNSSIYVRVKDRENWNKLKKIDNQKMNEYSIITDTNNFFDSKDLDLVLNSGWSIDEDKLDDFVENIVSILKKECIVIGMTNNFNVDPYTYLVYYLGDKIVKKSFESNLEDNDNLVMLSTNSDFKSIDKCILYLNKNKYQFTKKEILNLENFGINIKLNLKTTLTNEEKKKQKIIKELINWEIDFEDIDDKYKNDEDVVIKALQCENAIFSQIGEELKSNYDFIKKMLKKYCISYCELSDNLKEDKNLLEIAIKYGNISYISLPEIYQNDRNIVLDIANNTRNFDLKVLPEIYQGDEEIVLASLKSNINNLEYASNNLKKSETFMQKAIVFGEGVLKYFDKDIMLDEKNKILSLIKNEQYDYHDLPNKYKSDKEIILEIIKINEYFPINKLNKKLLNDRDIVVEAVKSNGMNIAFFSENYKNDKEIVLLAIKNDPWAFEYISNTLKLDNDVLNIISKDEKYKSLFDLITSAKNNNPWANENPKDDSWLNTDDEW